MAKYSVCVYRNIHAGKRKGDRARGLERFRFLELFGFFSRKCFLIYSINSATGGPTLFEMQAAVLLVFLHHQTYSTNICTYIYILSVV